MSDKQNTQRSHIVIEKCRVRELKLSWWALFCWKFSEKEKEKEKGRKEGRIKFYTATGFEPEQIAILGDLKV